VPVQVDAPKKLFRVTVVDEETRQVLSPSNMADSYWEQRTILENIAQHIGIDNINVSLDEADDGDFSSYFILYHKGEGLKEKILKTKCSRVLDRPFEVRYRDYEHDTLRYAMVRVENV